MAKWKLPEKYRTIYWQNFMLTAGVVLLTLSLLGTSFFAVSYAYVINQRTEDMQNKAQIVSDLVSGYMTNRDTANIRAIVRVAASTTDVEYLVCGADGSVILMTGDAREDVSTLSVPQKVMRKVLEEGEYSKATSLDGIYSKKQYVVGVPIYYNDHVVGATLAVMEAQHLTAIWRAFFSIFVMTTVIALLLSFAASAWVSMRQSRPIHEMAEATRLFAEGNFDTRMHDYGAGEIGELADSFNNMADSLQETERQRSEFIANISHELKTPMTSIAGYTDGILDGTIPPEREKEYLHIISDESRRLSRLVRRMLEVSQLQSREHLRKVPFDVCESMRRVLISLEKKITDRSLDVEADIPDEPVTVLGDNDLITQVIYNLLENATKFATPGTALYLGVSVANGKALVTVRNHGATISAEELPLLFERFHKSDKSRSADKDGVGLGLYIVKTILEQHKEHIVATSEDGVTTFAFTLSLANSMTST